MRLNPLAERPWKGLLWLTLEEAGVVVARDRVRIPYRLPDGRELYAKIVTTTGRVWCEPPPLSVGGLVPFGLETLPVDRRDESLLFVNEGESCALAVREALAKWDRFPGGVYTIALPGAGTWRPAWRDYVKDFRHIVVVPDGDEPGDRMADAVLRDLPWSRRVLLPAGEDARSIVQAGGARGLMPFLAAADLSWRMKAALLFTDGYETFKELVDGGLVDG